MIIPDINLLLYAYDSSSPDHAAATAWWESSLSGPETVGLPHVVLFGFIRIATNARVFANPLTPVEAARNVSLWLAQPPVLVLEPGPDHVPHVLRLLEKLGAAGNLVTDAQLAALAIDYNAVVHTTDTDFIRFSGLRWFNPINKTRSPD